jgi:hypothetical protein
MQTADGPISFPNAAVLSSATGVRDQPGGNSQLNT